MTREEMIEDLADREMDVIFEAGIETFVRNVLIYGSSRKPYSMMTEGELTAEYREVFYEEDEE